MDEREIKKEREEEGEKRNTCLIIRFIDEQMFYSFF
jgi:hypothetical protein